MVEKQGGREFRIASGVLARMPPKARAEFAHQWRHVDAVALEAPFSTYSKSMKTFFLMAASMGQWHQAFGALGVAIEQINADEWQQGLLRGLITKSTKREARKLAAQRWTAATFGLVALPAEDEADAAGLAVWCARQRAFNAKTALARG